MIREGGTQANASFFCFLLLKTESLMVGSKNYVGLIFELI